MFSGKSKVTLTIKRRREVGEKDPLRYTIRRDTSTVTPLLDFGGRSSGHLLEFPSKVSTPFEVYRLRPDCRTNGRVLSRVSSWWVVSLRT